MGIYAEMSHYKEERVIEFFGKTSRSRTNSSWCFEFFIYDIERFTVLVSPWDTTDDKCTDFVLEIFDAERYEQSPKNKYGWKKLYCYGKTCLDSRCLRSPEGKETIVRWFINNTRPYLSSLQRA
jgi:hypothetical protein